VCVCVCERVIDGVKERDCKSLFSIVVEGKDEQNRIIGEMIFRDGGSCI